MIDAAPYQPGTGPDWAAWVAAGVSAIACVVSVIFACLSRGAADRANQIATGSLESQLRGQVTLARHRVEDVGTKIAALREGKETADLTYGQKKQLVTFGRAFRSAVEDYLNAYEVAGGKYFDGKVDKTRFRSEYRNEIANICKEDGPFATHMHPVQNSKFTEIWRLYHEWFGEPR